MTRPRCVGPQVSVGQCGECGVPNLIIHVHSEAQLREVLSRAPFLPQVGPGTRKRLEKERRWFVDRDKDQLEKGS